ncbi:MAG: hypothetical protein WCY10_01675, partial [Candidatus Omnitrophota bacterium]
MRRFVTCTFFAAALFLRFVVAASADMVYLNNGRDMECMVVSQSKDSVELEVEIGTIRLRLGEIRRIEKFTAGENALMRQRWMARKAKVDIARKALQEAESARQEQERQRQASLPKEIDMKFESGHMIASARLNRIATAQLLVDTGASVVVLSRSMGEKLGL